MTIVWHVKWLHNGRFMRRKRTRINASTTPEHCETVAVLFHNAFNALTVSYPMTFEQMPPSARCKRTKLHDNAIQKPFVQS